MNTDLYEILPGTDFWIPKNDTHVSRWQWDTGRLDHDVWSQEKILPYIKNFKYFLDGGSFNGDHTLFYSKIAGEGGEVLAIEAGKVAYDALEHNVDAFIHENVIPVRCAIWNCDGERLVHCPRENLGASGVGKEGGSDMVKTLTIDTLSRLYDISFEWIKLDIEGAEVHALEGARNTLSNLRPTLLLEVNPERLADFGKCPEDLYKILDEFNYLHAPIQDMAVTEGQHDIICLPQS